MTIVTYRREGKGISPIPISIEFIETPKDQPFNPDGFIELIAEKIYSDVKAGKFDHLIEQPTTQD